MTTKEIAQEIAELEKRKLSLQAQLSMAIEKEMEEGNQARFNKTKEAILKLWAIFWKDDDNTESTERLNKVTEQDMLDRWLAADVKDCLKRCALSEDGVNKIKEILKTADSKCDLEECILDAKIRLDFASALRGVKKGRDLSYSLGWGFSKEDILVLTELHKKNKFRKKIEELLTDCNFHTECELLCEGKYDKVKDLDLC